jgi:tetratricopeptide (TPR) repeat protein
MDHNLGRLVAAFEERAAGGPARIAVIGDHGEGLGEHGEALHGRLLYQATIRVPLVVAGSGIQPGRVERAVSAREAYGTLLGWAEGNVSAGWLDDGPEPVLGEALKPHLQYGWQPQVMGVLGTLKVIRSGDLEVFDLAADPGETTNLAVSVQLDRRLQAAVRDYPIAPGRPADDSSSGAETLGAEAAKKLASLGYFDSGSRKQARENAPNPKDMTHIFRDLDIGSGLFVREKYAEAIPFFERALAADSENSAVTLQLAVAHSVLGDEQRADHYFELAQSIDPASIDLRHYHAMHLFRFGRWEDAAPLFESVLAEMPNRLPALERMAEIREKEGRFEEARRYLERAVALAPEPVDDLTRLGELSMAVQDTAAAIRAFERAREVAGDGFTHFLELGVCYLAAGRFSEAADTLDRVPRLHPGHPMALFKRAQAAVLLNDPDWRERVRRAYASADETTRRLIESEPLFRGFTGAPGAEAR